MILDPADLYGFRRNLVLSASAGTGKTHALVGVVVRLLVGEKPVASARAQPLDPARIVATTFSRKAAAEIRTRITAALEQLGAAPATSPYFDALRRASADLEAPAERRALSEAEIAKRARRALARIEGARVGTLHSFATGIVRAYAVELALGPGFELATEADARARAEDAIARALEARLATHARAIRSLTEAAGGIDRLVSHLRRALGALEEDGRSARDIEVADDTGAIERTLRRLVGHAQDLLAAPKFEPAARELIRAWESGDEEALPAAAAAFTAVAATGKKSPEVEAFAAFRKGLPGGTNEEKGRALGRAFASRHRLRPYAEIARDVLADAEADIEATGRARASLGFGEILRAARALLLSRPDVADEVAAEIDALLVDEFQDTSRVQRDLLQLLRAKPGAREAGRVPPLASIREQGLLVVGDRKQSIYGFRGADVSVFAELAVGLAGEPARRALGIPMGMTWEPDPPLADFCALRENRRSVPEILAFANAFSARRFCPGDPPPPQLFEIAYVPETEDLLVPCERRAVAPASAEEPRARATWLRVQPKGSTSTRLEEALVLAARIRTLVAGGEVRVGRERRAPRFRDVAVLATTNGMLDAAAFALAQAGVPHVVAGKSFFRAREVRDLAAMLALVLDPADRIAALTVLRGPWASVRDETLLGLSRPAEGLTPAYAWTSPPRPEHVRDEDRAAIARLSALVSDLSRAAGRLGPGAVLREAARALAFEEVLAALPRGEQRVANARKLLAMADRHADTRSFAAWLDDASAQELSESEAATFSEDDDAVRLLTVHASKGLDFPVVFVPEIGAALPRSDKGAVRVELGANDAPNLLAVRLAGDDGAVIEPPSFAKAYASSRRRDRAERQRLAYVAVTRAADAVFFVGGRSKEGGGDPGASSIAVLEELASSGALDAELTEVPPSLLGDQAHQDERQPDEDPGEDRAAPVARLEPRWRALPIAPTALADYAHCPRRFELVHLLGMPEHVRGRSTASSSDARGEGPRVAQGPLDARTQGTLAHAVLERVPVSAFAGDEAVNAAARALTARGIAEDHPQRGAILARVTRFLGGPYAREIRDRGAEVRREVAFVLTVGDDEGRSVVLRGSMDLVVLWPDGGVDVVDYKSARGGGPEAYAFQLDVYALAARAAYPEAARLRVGLVFLGGASGEPSWRALEDDREVRARIARLGGRLARARWGGAFPRVRLERCEAIHCGFIGRCHAEIPLAGADAIEPASNGTDENDSDVTTT